MTFRNIPILFTCILWTTVACNRAKQSDHADIPTGQRIEIEGILEDGAAYNVVLEEMAAREFIPVDTATCNENGAFHIRFESEKTAFYVLRTGPAGYITLLMEPGEKVVFNGLYGQPDQYTVKGSNGSELLMELAKEHKNALNILGAIAKRNMESQSSADYVRIKTALDLQFDSVRTAFQDFSLEFIHRNQESLAILIALYNIYGKGLPVFHPDEDLEVYRYVDSVLSLKYKGFEAVDLLHSQVLEADAARNNPMQKSGPAVGEIAPDFVSSTPDGGQMALSELRGNYVLLSFWAGWSKPSREENATLRNAWATFGHMPFRILQVSFDGDKEVWIKALEQDKLDWFHVGELRRWETKVADLYQVEKIPANYLIDPAGKIRGVDLFGTELMDELERLFSRD